MTSGAAAGKLEEALSAYLKAQRYLRVHPPLEGERAVASRVSACLNGAMCWLKLEVRAVAKR